MVSMLTQPAGVLGNYCFSWFWYEFSLAFHVFWMLSGVFLSHTTLLPHYPHSLFRSSLGLPIYLTASPWIHRKGMNDGCRQPVTRGVFPVPVLCSDWLLQCLFCLYMYWKLIMKGSMVVWYWQKKEISKFSGIFLCWCLGCFFSECWFYLLLLI